MISEMLRVRDGCIRRIVARTSTLSVEARPGFQIAERKAQAFQVVSASNRFSFRVSDFPYRPSGKGSGQKLQTLLSQREVMLQLPLHSQLQILRWTCARKVPRIFLPGFDQ